MHEDTQSAVRGQRTTASFVDITPADLTERENAMIGSTRDALARLSAEERRAVQPLYVMERTPRGEVRGVGISPWTGRPVGYQLSETITRVPDGHRSLLPGVEAPSTIVLDWSLDHPPQWLLEQLETREDACLADDARRFEEEAKWVRQKRQMSQPMASNWLLLAGVRRIYRSTAFQEAFAQRVEAWDDAGSLAAKRRHLLAESLRRHRSPGSRGPVSLEETFRLWGRLALTIYGRASIWP